MGRDCYHRSFIILKPAANGLDSFGGKEATGYCKLEIRKDRAKIHIYVQNLRVKNASRDLHDVYLVSASEGIAPQRIAQIKVDERGRGESMLEVDVNNVQGSGNALGLYHAMALVDVTSKERGDISITYPLVGYSSKHVSIDWAGKVAQELIKKYKPETEAMTDLVTAQEGTLKPMDELGKDVIGSQAGQQVNEKDMEVQGTEDKKIDDYIKEEQMSEGVQVKGQLAEGDIKVQDGEGKESIEGYEYEGQEDKEDMQYEEQLGLKDTKEREAGHHKLGGKPYGEQEDINDRHKAQPAEEEGEDRGAQEQGIDGGNGHGQGQDEGDLYGGVHNRERLYEKGDEALLQHIKGERPNGKKVNYWDNVKDYFMGLFNTHRLICPFEEDMEEAEWIRVQREEAGYPHYCSGTFHYYNQPCYPYFDHYIVGLIRRMGKVCYVVYGIPSLYSMLPPMAMSGFSRWLPMRKGYGMGYWLLYIDAETGSVVYPY